MLLCFVYHCILCSTGLCPDVYPDHDCRPTHAKTVEDPPLLFDLYHDPSEVYTLTPDDPVYNQTMAIISKVILRNCQSWTKDKSKPTEIVTEKLLKRISILSFQNEFLHSQHQIIV